jgi:hypothetical protein
MAKEEKYEAQNEIYKKIVLYFNWQSEPMSSGTKLEIKSIM